MKHLFVVNPVAGKQKPEEKIKLIHDSADRVPGGLAGGFEIYVTRAPMDAVEKIRSAAEGEDDLRVYACGGDGTLNECVNGAAGLKNVAVTHFPCGTGNDFIKMFGADKSRFFDLAELANGEVRPLDLIKCNGRYSINICSMGLDARVGTDVHKYSGLPLLGGPAGYVASLAVNFVKGVSQPMTVTADGLTCGPRLNLVCICNGRFYGGGFNPTNDARPDDGLLDVLIVSGVRRPTILRAISAYASGRYREYPQYITFLRTTHVEVQTPTAQVINEDGEAEYSDRTVFDVVPGGVNFLVPRGMAFFSGK